MAGPTDDEFEALCEAASRAWPQSVRSMWESRRTEMIRWAIEEKKFNPKAAPKFVDNFIDSMVYVAESEAAVAVSTMRRNRQARKVLGGKTDGP